MKVGLETSVLMRLLSGDPEDLALVALRYLWEREQAGDRILVSDWVLAETYYALQQHYGLSKKESLDALRDFLATPNVESTGVAAEILTISNLESAKPGFIDRLIYRNYLSSGAAHMATFEKASAKLPHVQLLT